MNKISIKNCGDYSYLKRADLHAYLKSSGIDILPDEAAHFECTNTVYCFDTISDAKKEIDSMKLRGLSILVYCYEPRFDISRSPYYNYSGNDIHVMNAYTGDVYINIFYDFRPDHIALKNAEFLIQEKKKNYSHKVSQLSSYHQWMLDQRLDEDLVSLRNSIGMYFSTTHEFFKLYGRSWPSGVATQGDSRSGDWQSSKKELLSDTFFNVAIENTLSLNYVTEKIYDSISCLNLPIYCGNPWIDDIFPSNSYIDTRLFSSPRELLSFILSITSDEWESRLILCLDRIKHISMSDINKFKIDVFTLIKNKIQSL